jgi:hypothetical protein
VPEVEAVIVADADEFERRQSSAVPPGTISYVTVPPVDPPEVERERLSEYG